MVLATDSEAISISMIFSLRTKLSLSYILVALLLVAVISYITNTLLEKQFKEYVMQQQEQRNTETVEMISKQFVENENKWDEPAIENIGVSALAQGVIVKVKDASGNVVWDANEHNYGMCSAMLEHMAMNMTSRYPDFEGGYVETSYPVTLGATQVGSVDIGYYGPYYFTDNDLAFINTLNRLLIGTGVFALLFALLLGAYMAKRLTTPISRVIASASQISRGYFGDRIRQETTTREIGQLTTTINDLAETLEKQDILRKQLTADVAHELRTPLATLQSHMEAMIDGIWEPNTVRLKSCHDEIIRINRMIGDLEKLAKYESENLILNKSEFDISELIQSIIRNMELDFANKGVKVTFLRGSIGNIAADKDKISQVFINIFSNALKYTPEGGVVEVAARCFSGEAEISIKDTGVGISPEDLPHIFERFYRADKSRNRMTGGSGIGLAIVKAIIEAHKGSVRVKSDPGKGSEFVITLPKQAE